MDMDNAKVRVGRVAGLQFGRVSRAQLRGITDDRTIKRWLDQGYLHRRLPHVYAVGHVAPTVEGDLAEAILYAGQGSMLSHTTVAWWLGLLHERPRVIDVSTPRRCRSLRGVRVHAERSCQRTWHKGLPVTTLPQAVLDLAAVQPVHVVRMALARADYQNRLDLQAVQAVLGRGRPGSTRLKAALRAHQPALARTKSDLEVLMIEFCEQEGIELPEINTRVDGWEVDALWRMERVAVELDGHGNHRSRGQLRRDHRKDLHLRSLGFTTVRYTDEQLTCQRPAVLNDLREAGAPIPPGRSAGRGSR
jgi:very-short-patch-repair endonuclease